MKLTIDIVKQKAILAKKHELYPLMKNSIESLNGTPIIEVIPETEEKLIVLQELGKTILVLLSPDDLFGNGTYCGRPGNKCFNKKVVDFLKSKNVLEIFCSVSLEDGIYHISGAGIKMSEKDGDKLSNLVGCGNGSWRSDVGINEDYCAFESE